MSRSYSYKSLVISIIISSICFLGIMVRFPSMDSRDLGKKMDHGHQTHPSAISVDTGSYLGAGAPRQGTARAIFTDSSPGVGISNTSNTNVSLFVDGANNWQGIKYNTSVTGIKDTRDWVTGGSYNDSIVDPGSNPAFVINQEVVDYHYPNGTYFPDMAFIDSYQFYSNDSIRAMRVHFQEINIHVSDDLEFYDADFNILHSISSSQTNFYTDWFQNSSFYVGYTSNGNVELENLFTIDHVLVVPVNETYNISLESPHDYPPNLDGSTGDIISSAAPGTRFMRAHFSAVELEGGGYDYLTIYDNDSNPVLTYDTGGSYYTDEWLPWIESNEITLNLTSDGTIQYYGYKIDKYQWSDVAEANFASKAIQYNITINWNHYLDDQPLGSELIKINATSGTHMRLNFSHVNFQEGYDYLVLLDNESQYLMDFTGYHENVVTPWFRTDYINLTYISDNTRRGEIPYNPGYRIDHVEWVDYPSLNLTERENNWVFDYNYQFYDGRASGYGAERDDEIGLALELQAVNETTGGGYGWDVFSYEPSDRVEFYQTIPISRGKVLDGYIELDYYGDKVLPTGDLQLFVAINDTVVYTRGFSAISQAMRQWQSTGKIWMALWENTTNLFDAIGSGSEIKLSVGLRYDYDESVLFSGFEHRERQLLVVDDIKLVLTTLANATQPGINLQVNGNPIQDGTGSKWGDATFAESGTWTINPLNLTFTTDAGHLEFDVTSVMEVETIFNSTRIQDISHEGTLSTVDAWGDVYWSFYENVYLPAGYSGYNLTVEIPDTWEIVEVLTPSGGTQAYVNGSTGDGSFWFSTGAPGWHKVTARSSNFINTTRFSPDNTTWFANLTVNDSQQVFLSTNFNGTVSVPSGSVILEVFTPAGTSWYIDTFSLVETNNITFNPVEFASTNTTGGIYHGYIAWENGTEVGFVNFSICSKHSSLLNLLYPSDAKLDNGTVQNVESIVPLRVAYNDSFTENLIPGATVLGRLNSSPTVDFSLVESGAGIYDYSLDTAGLQEGMYQIEINATKQGYENATMMLHLKLRVETRITSFSSYHALEHGFNATIPFYYEDASRNTGITGASVNVSFELQEYQLLDHGNGSYDIIVNSTGLDTGSQPFTITAFKAFHEDITLEGTFDISPRKSRLLVSNGTLQGNLGDPVGPYIITFQHPDYPGTIRYSGASISLYTDATMQDPIDPANYTVTNVGDGQYTITLETGIGTVLDTPGLKTLYVLATNGSSSPYQVDNGTITLSMALDKRTIIFNIFYNGTNYTSLNTISTGLQNDLEFNVTIVDNETGSPVTGYQVDFNITNGHSGNFGLVGDTFSTIVDHGNLSEGTFVITIEGSGIIHEAFGKQFVLIVQPITTYTEGFESFYLVEHGFPANISFHYHDATNDLPVPGASINVTLAGIGVIESGNYTLVDHSNGNYSIILDTTWLVPAKRSMSIGIGKANHAPAILNGTLELRERASELEIVNSSLSGYMPDDIGPVHVLYYHPGYPGTLNYTDATISLYLDASFTQPIHPSNYSITPLPDGTFSLSIRTGSGTPFNSPGIKNIYMHAENDSASPWYIATDSAYLSFALSLRPVNATVFLNDVNITGESGFSFNTKQSMIMNLSLQDQVNGSVPMLDIDYNVSGGPVGSFLLQDGNYTANISNGNFSTGIHVLSINSSAGYYETVSFVFLINIIPLQLEINVSVNASAVVLNSRIDTTVGQNVSIGVSLQDATTGSAVTGATVLLAIDGGIPVAMGFNGTTHESELASGDLGAGFHSLSLEASAANYSSAFFSFIIYVERRGINATARFNGTTWDGLSAVSYVLDEVIHVEIQGVDQATGSPIHISEIALQLPPVIISFINDSAGTMHSIRFNASLLSIGKHLLGFELEGDDYIGTTFNVVIDVLPMPMNLTPVAPGGIISGTPGGNALIMVNLHMPDGTPVIGANVSYTWIGGFDFLQDEGNGSYSVTIDLPRSSGIHVIEIQAYYSDDREVSTIDLTLSIQQKTTGPKSILITALVIGGLFLALFLIAYFTYLRPKIIKRRMVKFEDVKTCTVHKGPITDGLTYVCPTCGSIYCTKCAQALYNNNDRCWSCHAPIQPFAVSYLDDWRNNLIHMLVFLNGTTEPIHEQALSGEDVLVPEIFSLLKKNIATQVIKMSKGKEATIVQEYFNSKILYHKGEFVTVVIISRIESSFIKEKMKAFIQDFELLFYDKDSKSWKEGMQNKFTTKTTFLVEKMFIREEKDTGDGKGKKGSKGKGTKESGGNHVDPSGAGHKQSR
ncbi:hypothetical protein GF325_08535 [Candidatus Bathyarchaeota archaeon]|nr:hypothetical protein [Candidatus Bathyarchaeota archaeon]